MFKKLSLLCAIIFCLSGCQLMGGDNRKAESDYVKEDIRINKLIIRNGLAKRLDNVKFMVPDTDAFINIEHIPMGEKIVINFNKNYKSQERVILLYGSKSNPEKSIIRLPPIEKKNYSGYDLKIEILSFGTTVELK